MSRESKLQASWKYDSDIIDYGMNYTIQYAVHHTTLYSKNTLPTILTLLYAMMTLKGLPLRFEANQAVR